MITNSPQHLSILRGIKFQLYNIFFTRIELQTMEPGNFSMSKSKKPKQKLTEMENEDDEEVEIIESEARNIEMGENEKKTLTNYELVEKNFLRGNAVKFIELA